MGYYCRTCGEPVNGPSLTEKEIKKKTEEENFTLLMILLVLGAAIFIEIIYLMDKHKL